METNSNISSKPSEWGTVPKTQLELPLWRAIEMLWVKKNVDFLSPVSSMTLLPTSHDMIIHFLFSSF